MYSYRDLFDSLSSRDSFAVTFTSRHQPNLVSQGNDAYLNLFKYYSKLWEIWWIKMLRKYLKKCRQIWISSLDDALLFLLIFATTCFGLRISLRFSMTRNGFKIQLIEVEIHKKARMPIIVNNNSLFADVKINKLVFLTSFPRKKAFFSVEWINKKAAFWWMTVGCRYSPEKCWCEIMKKEKSEI